MLESDSAKMGMKERKMLKRMLCQVAADGFNVCLSPFHTWHLQCCKVAVFGVDTNTGLLYEYYVNHSVSLSRHLDMVLIN